MKKIQSAKCFCKLYFQLVVMTYNIYFFGITYVPTFLRTLCRYQVGRKCRNIIRYISSFVIFTSLQLTSFLLVLVSFDSQTSRFLTGMEKRIDLKRSILFTIFEFFKNRFFLRFLNRFFCFHFLTESTLHVSI